MSDPFANMAPMARRFEQKIGQRAWWRGRLCALDLETTGPDAHHDRLVSAAVVWVGGGVPTETQCWLARPTLPIPPDVAAIHGISDELARVQGRDPATVVGEVADALRAAWALGLPVVAYNASFDLTVVAAELERHRLAPLALGPVIDPWVLDRHFDPERAERRRLNLVCRRYRVRLDHHHRADADALAAAELACAVAEAFPALRGFGLHELPAAQARWRSAFAPRGQQVAA